MQTVVLSPNELTELIDKAVEGAIEKHIPTAIRQATKKTFLTTDELSNLTGWSRRTIQYLRDSRQLPFIQDGRRVLFSTDEIEKYLNERRVRARGK